MGPIQTQIVEILEKNFKPHHLEVVNESHMHSRRTDGESHFKVLVVSDTFVGLSRIERQRRINGVLQELLKGAVHALTQRVLTIAEWAAQVEQEGVFESPECVTRPRSDK